MKYLKPLSSLGRKEVAGAKAQSLRFLYRHHFRLPYTLVIPESVRSWYADQPGKTLKTLRDELRRVIKPEKSYAVRSSAEREDGEVYSFAGQFETRLDVRGADDIVQAILAVWKSADEIEDRAYGRRVRVSNDPSGMGVLVQEMVEVQWAGVGFSVNPVNGRNEIVVEGVRDSGSRLVQDGVDPVRWVYRNGSRASDPVGDGTASPGTEVLDELVEGIGKLRDAWKSEVDVEWAFDGINLYFLQCRTVTTRRYPTVYSNHISRGFLPGMIKPLVWSVNISIVNRAWIRLLENVLGPLGITPDQLSRTFYYRAYFNMGTFGALFRLLGLPRESLEYLMGVKESSGRKRFRPSIKILRYLPRLIWFPLTNLRPDRRFRRWSTKFSDEVHEIDDRLSRKGDFDIGDYPALFDRLISLTRRAAYFNILIPLSMYVTDSMLSRKLKKRNVPPEVLEFAKDFPMLRKFDPQYDIRNLRRLWGDLPEESRTAVPSGNATGSTPQADQVDRFRTTFDAFMDRFGFFSQSGNDLSEPHWDEDPDFVMSLIQSADPDEPGAGSGLHPEERDRVVSRLGSAYRRAGRYRLYREMVSAEYARDYGLLRKLFLRTGAYLERAGRLRSDGDVFFLTLEEHDRLLDDTEGEFVDEFASAVSKRKREMAAYRDISLPSIIYGDTAPPLDLDDQDVYRGIPTSPGHFEGRITVVRGYDEFDKEIDGTILVIPFADVGWTPILTRAGAIVSESGGMLSHTAIVARELSIPSISSVDHACRLKDGTMARIDGYHGFLTIME